MSEAIAQEPLYRHATGTFTGGSKFDIFFQTWLPTQSTRRASLVLVHGVGEHSGRYANLIDSLVPRSISIYAADHQGHGRSGGAQGHVDRFLNYLLDVDKIVGMARQENPELPLVLFGHSMGGLIALYYALEYQDKLDYMIVSAPALKADASPLLLLFARFMNRINPRFRAERPGDASGVSRDAIVVQALRNDPNYFTKSSVRWGIEILSTQKIVNSRAAEIKLPTLIVQGSADRVVRPDATAAFFEQVGSTDKTLKIYEGYYHELHNDLDKEKPLEDIADWLDRKLSSRQE